MTDTKLMIRKVKRINPKTKTVGYSTSVIINGTTSVDDIATRASSNTTMHKGEIKLGFELALDAAAAELRAGNAVDLGPLGKIYPSVTGKWTEKADEQKKSDLTKGVYYHPSESIKAAIEGSTLSWESTEDEKNESSSTGTGTGTGTGTSTGDGSTLEP